MNIIADLINAAILTGFVFAGFWLGYWYRGKKQEDYEPF